MDRMNKAVLAREILGALLGLALLIGALVIGSKMHKEELEAARAEEGTK